MVKRVIALAWEAMDRPRKVGWFSGLTSTLPLEKITYAIRGKIPMFGNILEPLCKVPC